MTVMDSSEANPSRRGRRRRRIVAVVVGLTALCVPVAFAFEDEIEDGFDLPGYRDCWGISRIAEECDAGVTEPDTAAEVHAGVGCSEMGMAVLGCVGGPSLGRASTRQG